MQVVIVLSKMTPRCFAFSLGVAVLSATEILIPIIVFRMWAEDINRYLLFFSISLRKLSFIQQRISSIAVALIAAHRYSSISLFLSIINHLIKCNVELSVISVKCDTGQCRCIMDPSEVMYMMKSKGPKTDPCGTPYSKVVSYKLPLVTTACRL